MEYFGVLLIKITSALLHWESKNLKEANFQALLKPLTVLEVFD